MLFQLHIPKTGGTTLFSVLSAAVYPGRWHVALSEADLLRRMTGYAFVSGHFTWDLLARFPERPQVVTVLRDPVEMALSLYGYWRVHARDGIFNPDNQVNAEETLARSIDELILDADSGLRASLGVMTSYLAGIDEVTAGRGLESALRHLDACAWVGTTDTLDRDMQLLPAMLGLLPIEEPARKMVNAERPQRTELSREALQLIESHTQSDRILYDRARAIAEEQQRRFA